MTGAGFFVQLRHFRPIPGFQGYWVSHDGHVFSTRSGGRGHGPRLQFLTQRPHPRTGHMRVDLKGDAGARYTIQVQRLVAWAWLGPQPEGSIVAHWDGDEVNNACLNLYYATHSDNALDREHHARGDSEARSERELHDYFSIADYDDTTWLEGVEYEPDPRWGF